MSVSGISSSMAGIAAAQMMFGQTAAQVADGDVVEGVVGSTVAKVAFEANVAVLKMALDMERSLVDVLA